jgi:hypothetical protein
MNPTTKEVGGTNAAKQPWEPMKLTNVGHIREIVLGGGGKLSINAADMGDIRKPKGQG